MTALSDLIARLGAAKEGSRELDAEIVRVFNEEIPPRHYTTSLDAALTLVPDNFVISLHIGPGPIRHASVGMYESRGATIAIALCIAAMKAREAAR